MGTVRVIAAAIIAAALSFASAARAQPSGTPTPPTPTTPATPPTPATPTPTTPATPTTPTTPPPGASPLAQPPPALPHQRSPGVGVGLAVAGTILPAVGFGIGLKVGGDTGANLVIGSVLGGVVLPSAGLIYAQRRKSIGMIPRGAAVVVLVFGALVDGLGGDDADRYYTTSAVLYGLGSAIDIVMTPSAVRAYNRGEDIAPIKVRIGAARIGRGTGLALGGTF